MLPKDSKQKRRLTVPRGQGGSAGHATGLSDAADGQGDVPKIVADCIAYLDDPEMLKMEGIFRISGSMTEIKSFKDSYNKKKTTPDIFALKPDPHVVAGALKMFFREAPVPLLTFELYDCWVAAIGAPDEFSRLTCVSKVIALLPPSNRNILKLLLGLLKKVKLNPFEPPF